jgi:hypothetical protein
LVLIQRGVRVLTANGDDLTDTSDPSRVMMRQIAGAFAQYEKARLVAPAEAGAGPQARRDRQVRRVVWKVTECPVWSSGLPDNGANPLRHQSSQCPATAARA